MHITTLLIFKLNIYNSLTHQKYILLGNKSIYNTNEYKYNL